ncbi:MAG: alpha/beta hydrolase fold protein [Gammaproteobacteria bacterium]|jgi:pimeloyl-ACP methyl ester carboxylesterase|nr:alpha/beta hydrolase fold protein [Gammaproteobacteria bacterium]
MEISCLPPEILGKEHTDFPLLLIPGLGADSKVWASAKMQLAQYHQVIALNNRGVGISQDLTQSYTTYDMMEDVVRQMDALDIEQAHILGHSLGGAVAQLLAIHHPKRVKKLLLICTRAFFGKKSVFQYDLIIKYLEMGLPRELLIQNLFLFLFGTTFFEDEKRAKDLIHLTALMPPNMTLHNYRLQVQAAMRHDSREKLHKINAPTLVMIGAEDVICLPKYSLQLSSAIPLAETIVLENAGHMPFVEAETLFIENIVNFLRRE